MNIENLKVEEIIPYENNPRNNDAAVPAVAESIKQFGFKVPIVIDKNKVIVCGHTRLKAAIKLGMTEVPCVVADDLSEEQIKAFRLADNKVSELATWNEEMLKIEIDDIKSIDLEDFGFDLDSYEEPVQVEEDDYDFSSEVEPKAKKGDIFQLGNHRLMCGDSTDIEDVELLMNGDKANLLITDPPYNVNYEGGTDEHLTIENDNMDSDSFHDFLLHAFVNAFNSLEDGASFYVWYASREVVNFQTAIEESGFTVKQELIWCKDSLVLGRQDYQWRHEPCLYGWKETGSHSFYGDRKQTTILEFQRPKVNDIHPTMKPVPLFSYQIQNSTNSRENNKCLDLFGGSGTTIIACEQTNRKAYVMEFDPRYVDAIIDRWEKLTGKKAIKIVEGKGE